MRFYILFLLLGAVLTVAAVLLRDSAAATPR